MYIIHYSVLKDLPKDYCSYHFHLPRQLKENVLFKNTAKSSIKTMDNSSQLNTDLGGN